VAENIVARLTTSDPCVEKIIFNNQEFGNIGPGKTVTSPKEYRIIAEDCGEPLKLKVELFSNGEKFWDDGRIALRTITEADKIHSPIKYSLHQNYPNPFNPTTTIEYSLSKPGFVRITIYDMLGRHIRTLINTRQTAGHFQTSWNGTDDHNMPVAAGVYFYRMEAGDFIKVAKLALVK